MTSVTKAEFYWALAMVWLFITVAMLRAIPRPIVWHNDWPRVLVVAGAGLQGVVALLKAFQARSGA